MLSVDVTFLAIIAAVGVLAGGVASIAGFGIGSFLTPVLAIRVGAGPAVALVAIPHVLATCIRLWWLRRSIDRTILRRFGLASALGGLVGALGHAAIRGVGTSFVLGGVLVLAGSLGVSGVLEKVRIGPRGALLAGAASGAFGGLVGNQGGLRSAAMLAFDLPRDAFVATAAAVALIVDLVRVPVYMMTTLDAIVGHLDVLAVACVSVSAGTLAGGRALQRVPEKTFRRVVSGLVLATGLLVILCAIAGVPGFAG